MFIVDKLSVSEYHHLGVVSAHAGGVCRQQELTAFFLRVIACAAVGFADCAVIRGDEGSDGVFAAFVIIAEAPGLRHKGVQPLIHQCGGQVGRLAVVFQFVQFALNGIGVTGNVIVVVCLINPVVVHVEAIVLHDLFQVGVDKAAAVGGHEQADVAAVVQIGVQFFGFCVGNILGGCCDQHQGCIFRHSICLREVQFFCSIVVVGQVSRKTSVAVQGFFAVTGQEVNGRRTVFCYTLNGAGDEVFALEVLAGGVAVVICISGVHGRTWNTFFYVVTDKDHVTGRKGEGVVGVDLFHGVIVRIRIDPDEVDGLVCIIFFQRTVQRQRIHVVFQALFRGQNVEVYCLSLAVQLIQILFCGRTQTVLFVRGNVPAEIQPGDNHIQYNGNDQDQDCQNPCHAGKFGVFPVVEMFFFVVLTHGKLPPAPASFFNGNNSPDQEYDDFSEITQQIGESHQSLGEYIKLRLIGEPAQHIGQHRNAGEERVYTQIVHQHQQEHGKLAHKDCQQRHFRQRRDEDAQCDADQTEQEESDVGTDEAGPDHTAVDGGEDGVEQRDDQHHQQDGGSGKKLRHDDLGNIQRTGEQQGLRAVFPLFRKCPHGQQR